MKAPWLAVTCALALLLAGCASEPQVMRLHGTEGEMSLVFPAPQTGEVPRYRYVGQPDERVVLQRPQTGTVDSRGRVLVTDASRNAVFVFDEVAGKLDVWERATPARRFEAPVGIATGRSGEVLVADAELAGVFRFSPDGTSLGHFGNGLLTRPTGIARDPVRGRIYVFGERGQYVGNLVRPKGVAADDEGNLYVIESMYDTLLTFDPKARLLMSIGGTGLDAGRFYLPAGVWTDSRNRSTWPTCSTAACPFSSFSEAIDAGS